jgi:PTH1 family peptidyl-tRNA hydrolase
MLRSLFKKGGVKEEPILVAGLGNPGADYENSRHNAGFLVLDRLAEKLGIKSERSVAGSPLALADYSSAPLYLLKPMSFMNRSGVVVSKALAKLSIKSISRLIVLHDEIDITFGDIRQKNEGGIAGHNGLKSVVEHLGSKDFRRIRFGVGRPEEGVSVVDHVLSSFPPDAEEKLPELIDMACGKVLESVDQIND